MRELLPHIEFPTIKILGMTIDDAASTAAGIVDMSYNTSRFNMTLIEAERQMQEKRYQEMQSIMYFMIWNVAANTGNRYANTAKITNSQTKAEWIEYQGTDRGYKGYGINGKGNSNGSLKMNLQFFAKKDLKMVNDAAN